MTSGGQSYYDLLGLTTKASKVEIGKAYRSLARLYHPDKGGKNADVDKFNAITEAKDLLTDNAKRKAYDIQLLSTINATRKFSVKTQVFQQEQQRPHPSSWSTQQSNKGQNSYYPQHQQENQRTTQGRTPLFQRPPNGPQQQPHNFTSKSYGSFAADSPNHDVSESHINRDQPLGGTVRPPHNKSAYSPPQMAQQTNSNHDFEYSIHSPASAHRGWQDASRSARFVQRPSVPTTNGTSTSSGPREPSPTPTAGSNSIPSKSTAPMSQEHVHAKMDDKWQKTNVKLDRNTEDNRKRSRDIDVSPLKFPPTAKGGSSFQGTRQGSGLRFGEPKPRTNIHRAVPTSSGRPHRTEEEDKEEIEYGTDTQYVIDVDIDGYNEYDNLPGTKKQKKEQGATFWDKNQKKTDNDFENDDYEAADLSKCSINDQNSEDNENENEDGDDYDDDDDEEIEVLSEQQFKAHNINATTTYKSMPAATTRQTNAFAPCVTEPGRSKKRNDFKEQFPVPPVDDTDKNVQSAFDRFISTNRDLDKYTKHVNDVLNTQNPLIPDTNNMTRIAFTRSFKQYFVDAQHLKVELNKLLLEGSLLEQSYINQYIDAHMDTMSNVAETKTWTRIIGNDMEIKHKLRGLESDITLAFKRYKEANSCDKLL